MRPALLVLCTVVSSFSFTIEPKVLDVNHYEGIDSSFGWILFQFDYRKYGIDSVRFTGNFDTFRSPEFNWGGDPQVVRTVWWGLRERDIHTVYSVDTIELFYKVAGTDNFGIEVFFRKWKDLSYHDSVYLSIEVTESVGTVRKPKNTPARTRIKTPAVSALGRIYNVPSAVNVSIRERKRVLVGRRTW